MESNGGCRKQGDEPLRSIKDEECLDWRTTVRFTRRTLLHGVS